MKAENNIILFYTECTPRNAEGQDLSAMVLRSRLISIFHGYMVKHPSTIALSIDVHGKCTRIFAQSQTELDGFVQAIGDHHFIQDYFTLSYPKSISIEQYNGKWAYFELFRIPAPKKTVDGRLAREWRDKRLSCVQSEKMPYLLFRSKSNGAQFTVPVRKREADQYCGFRPNNYGLSRLSDPFALPDF